MINNILLAFLLTLFAGLSTGIGGAIPFFFKKFKRIYLAFFLGLSAGVMIFVSFVDLFPHAIKHLSKPWAFLAFFVGMAVVVIIDILMPIKRNPHHMKRAFQETNTIQQEMHENLEDYEQIADVRIADFATEEDEEKSEKQSLSRLGILTAIAIAIHNFPEGIATFASTLSDYKIGISVTIAVALHNIPEGICVSIPIYFATRKKWRSFGFSFLSGLAEPLGALVAYLIFSWFLTDELLAASFAFVAGIMIYISLDELVPSAHEHGRWFGRRKGQKNRGHGHAVIAGIVLGMLIMAGSLLLIDYV